MRTLFAALGAWLAVAASAADTIATVAGGGANTAAKPVLSLQIRGITALAYDSAGNYYFSERSAIRRVSPAGIASVFAGNGTTGAAGDGGPATQAQMSDTLYSIAVDASGNVYFTDGNRIRRVNTGGIIQTVAGGVASGFSGDGGPATAALLANPQGVAIDGAGNLLIADTGNHRIRKVAGGNIQTVVGTGASAYGGDGGPALQATISFPIGIVGDGAGGYFLAHGSAPSRVRRVDAAGNISTFGGPVGGGIGNIARDAQGNLYLAVFFGNQIHKISAAGVNSILAGTGAFSSSGNGGPATSATIKAPAGVAVTPSGEVILTDVDTFNSTIRKVDAGGVITLFGGGGTEQLGAPGCAPDGTAATSVYFGGGGPFAAGSGAVAFDPAGLMHVADGDNHCVYRVGNTGAVTRVAGTGNAGFSGDGGQATSAALNQPAGLAFDAGGNLYIADRQNKRVRKVTPAGVISTVAGSPTGLRGDGVAATQALIDTLEGIAVNPNGFLHFVDTGTNQPLENSRGLVRKVDAAGNVRTVAGSATAGAVVEGSVAILNRLVLPGPIAFDAAGNLYIGEYYYVRKVDPAGKMTTVAGTGSGGTNDSDLGDNGPAASAGLNQPKGVAADADGRVYIADTFRPRIRVVGNDGVIRTLAGTGTFGTSDGGGAPLSATLDRPASMAWREATRQLAVFASGTTTGFSGRVRQLTLSDAIPDAFTFATQVGIPATPSQSNTITPSGFDAAASIAVTNGEYSIGCTGTFTAAPGTIQPGQSVCVRHTNSTTANQDTVTTLAIGGRTGTFTSTTPPAPGSLQVSPPSIDFGFQSMRTSSAPRTVTLTNNNVGSVTLNALKPSTGFGASSACSSIATGASCTVNVTFTPLAEGTASGSLTIQASIGNLQVTLAGVAERSLTTHYYRTILRREPDAAGKTFWNDEAARIAATGANVNEVWFAMAISFYSSPEYVGLNRSDTEYLTDLYRTFFNRDPDSGGLGFWSQQLAGGMPRGVALAEFLFSREFLGNAFYIFGNTQARPEVNMVMDFYRGLLARLPDNTGQAFWVGRFRTAQCGGSSAVRNEADTMSKQFVESTEYVGRNRTNVQFVGDLYNAFLRRGGDLNGVNFWIGRLDSQALTRDQVRTEFYRSFEFSLRVDQVVAQGCQP